MAWPGTPWYERAVSPRTIAVLGMHRSGTSCVTGTLEEAGVFLGAVSRKSVQNLKGNRERPTLTNLHDAVLAANSGAWDDPPATARWSVVQREQLRQFIAEYSDRPLWGFKDPRTLLLLDGWIALLPRLEFAGVFRHPLLVAQSLNRRNGVPMDHGLLLWRRYNEILLRAHRERSFPLVEFVSDPGVMRASLSRQLVALKLDIAPKRLRFYRPRLQTQRGVTGRTRLAPDIEHLYRAFQAGSGSA